MSDFDLDLRTAEDELDDPDGPSQVVLGILDGQTDPDEWISHIERDDVLVLAIEGELNELAAGFARDIRDMGGQLVHFREFLIISPPGRDIDTDRLN